MRRWMGLGAVFLGTVGQAEPRVALVAAGRCHDPDLIRVSTNLESALQSKLGDGLAGSVQLAQRFPEPPARSSDELREQIEASRAEYYQADYSSAERELRQVLDEMDVLEPGRAQWNLRVEAELLRAMVLGAAARPAEADESFRRVLQLAPDHSLDPDLYPPLTRARFERTRRQVAGMPKVALTVRSDPSGADIFLDGLRMTGKTPLSIELVPGRYTLRVSNGTAISMARRLRLTQPAALDMDLDFEASFRPSPFPCIAEGGPGDIFAPAAKLGRWIGVSEVIVARLGRTAAGERLVLGAVVQVPTAEKLREGSVHIGGADSELERSAELAEYLLGGKRTDNIRPAIRSAETLASAPVGVELAAPPRSPGNLQPIVQPEAPLQTVQRGWRTSLGSAFIGLGLLGLGAGTVFQVRSARAWSELSGYYSNGRLPSADDLLRVQTVRRRAQDQRNAATLAFAAGAFAVVSGSMFLLADSRADHKPGIASLAIAPAPGAIVISGSIR